MTTAAATATTQASFSDQTATAYLQAQIDEAAISGTGELRIPAGSYPIANLEMRSGVHLILEPGAILISSDPANYGNSGWNGAMIIGKNIENISITGQGIIDGDNNQRPGGEEGFRGYHALHFQRSKNIRLENITIQNAGNYALLASNSEDLTVENLTVQGGHDGLHIQACSRVKVHQCNLRTGDDCLAGTDNRDVVITDCYFNTSCNAFRLGVLNLIVSGCAFKGPGEFPHKVSVVRGAPRHSMGAAFIHFSPSDRNPKHPSDNWSIEDCAMSNLDAVYEYDHACGLWQTGQPAQVIRFKNITATEVHHGMKVRGDDARSLQLTLENVSISLLESDAARAVIQIRDFDSLSISGSTLTNDGSVPALSVGRGNKIHLGENNVPVLSPVISDTLDF